MQILHTDYTEQRIQDLIPLVKAGDCRTDAYDAFQRVPVDTRLWIMETLAKGKVGLITQPCFIVPVLSPEFCKSIIEWADARTWVENDAEEFAYRMPEIIVEDHDKAYDEKLKTVLLYGLAPWFSIIFGRLPGIWNSLQLTKYDVERSEGTYHIDFHSRYTATISLNDDFTGGGCAFRDGLLGTMDTPPVPVGHAMIFPGKYIMHRGTKVLSGERKLLTVWSEDREDTV